MSATIQVAPFVTTTAPGSFSTSTDGYVQGTFQSDPSVLQELAGGVLNSTETLPMWGGVGIYEDVPTPGNASTAPADNLGGLVGRATALANMTGFSVFDQAHHMIVSAQSQVPLALPYMSVHFFRFGTGARIVVGCDPALATLEGGLINAQVSWDFGAQRLVPFNAAFAANVITAATWASTNGGQVTFTTTSAHGVAVGASFTIAGMTPAGYNSNYVAITGTTGSTLVAAQPVNPGTSTVQGTLVAGGGALNVRLLRLNIGNSMTINYNTATGYGTWNRLGSAAVILI